MKQYGLENEEYKGSDERECQDIYDKRIAKLQGKKLYFINRIEAIEREMEKKPENKVMGKLIEMKVEAEDELEATDEKIKDWKLGKSISNN